MAHQKLAGENIMVRLPPAFYALSLTMIMVVWSVVSYTASQHALSSGSL